MAANIADPAPVDGPHHEQRRAHAKLNRAQLAAALLAAISDCDFDLAKRLVVDWRAPVVKRNGVSRALHLTICRMGDGSIDTTDRQKLLEAQDLLSALLDRGVVLDGMDINMATISAIPVEMFGRLIETFDATNEQVRGREVLQSITMSLVTAEWLGPERALILLRRLEPGEGLLNDIEKTVRTFPNGAPHVVRSVIRLYLLQKEAVEAPPQKQKHRL